MVLRLFVAFESLLQCHWKVKKFSLRFLIYLEAVEMFGCIVYDLQSRVCGSVCYNSFEQEESNLAEVRM